MTENQIVKKTTGMIRNSVTFKILTILFLVLILLIPAAMIESLIREREYRRDDVVREISAKWGNEQTISGPIISIPYRKYFEDEKGKRKYSIRHMHFLPDTVAVKGNLAPEIRYRGIYEAVLYNAKLEITGSFSRLPFEELNVPEENIIWSGASLCLGISDMRGIREQIEARFDKTPVSMNPGVESNDVIGSGVSVRIPVREIGESTPFHFSLNLNGSYQLRFVPVGRVTTAEISSPWETPSFDGAFLPVDRKIDEKGFRSQWKVLHLNRNYPQHWTGNKHQIADSAFGVKLFVSVNVYQKTMRTAKYAVMFIVFTFMAFFFSEVMNKKRVHPIQYLLVGLGITIFYTLLLSISEHLNFDAAYLLSGIAVITLITGYSKSILRDKYMAMTVGGILVILYTYLYLVLQQEDYALLMGSIGLFVVLSIVMYMTRKIDWYALTLEDQDR